MPDNKEIKFYSLHSLKGGVGKSTVSLIIGSYYASQNKKTVIIDADLSGTSLVDLGILQIKGNKKGALLSPDECLGRLRDDPDSYRSNFINHFLLCHPGTFVNFNIKKLFWNTTFRGLGKYLFFIPSSPLSDDINTIIPYLYEEDSLGYFRERFYNLIKKLISKEKIEILIIDTSPGLWGISKGILNLMEELPERCIFDKQKELFSLKKGICLVTSEDPNDYRALFRYGDKFLLSTKDKIFIKIIFNRIKSDLVSATFSKKIANDLRKSHNFSSEVFKNEKLNEFIRNSTQIREKREHKIESISKMSPAELSKIMENIEVGN